MAALKGSALGLVVGATDVASTVAFLGAFGLEQVGERTVSGPAAAGLYGLDPGPGAGPGVVEVELATPGAAVPSVWVVGGAAPGRLPGPFARTARAFDVYTADMDDALDHLAFTGLVPGPVGTLAVGPVTMRQCLVPGPDGMAVVLVESSHRRSSLLDDDPARLFSEGHSVVWSVDDMDAEARRLAAAGLTKGIDLAFSEPEVSTYLGLPRSPVPIRMTMLAGERVMPLRLELLEFPADPGPPAPADGRPAGLTGGLWALRIAADDPVAVATALAAAGGGRSEPVERAGGTTVAVTTPGGVRLQLLDA